jgi:flavin reductase (DIM6/NTAB) family NADH-FMN oxidoreductase RutF
MWSIPNGLFVLGTIAQSTRNMMTVSWVSQVATEPKLVGVGVESGSRSRDLIQRGEVFSLSFIPTADRHVVRRFVKPVDEEEIDIDGESGIGSIRGEAVIAAFTGAPILRRSAGWLDCRLRHGLDLGSHFWFVGEVMDVGEAPTHLHEDPESSSDAAVSEGAGSGDNVEVLRIQQTRMNYGG